MESNRRDFIKHISLAYGSILFFPGCSVGNPLFRFFTAAEANCIVAICERIIPADDQPGATDAGVIYYIDKQLDGVLNASRNMYRKGIMALQKYCMEAYGKEFEYLRTETQNKILVMLEKNEIKGGFWEGINSFTFFKIVISHTMQGFYGDPRHGGNKDFVSFRMLKIDYPLVVGQNRYRA